jgi:hypothetical protein
MSHLDGVQESSAAADMQALRDHERDDVKVSDRGLCGNEEDEAPNVPEPERFGKENQDMQELLKVVSEMEARLQGSVPAHGCSSENNDKLQEVFSGAAESLQDSKSGSDNACADPLLDNPQRDSGKTNGGKPQRNGRVCSNRLDTPSDVTLSARSSGEASQLHDSSEHQPWVSILKSRVAVAPGRPHAEYCIAVRSNCGRQSVVWRRFSDFRELQRNLEGAFLKSGSPELRELLLVIWKQDFGLRRSILAGLAHCIASYAGMAAPTMSCGDASASSGTCRGAWEALQGWVVSGPQQGAPFKVFGHVPLSKWKKLSGDSSSLFLLQSHQVGGIIQ